MFSKLQLSTGDQSTYQILLVCMYAMYAWGILSCLPGYEIHGMEKIPDKGPALIVYYHGAIPIDYYYFLANVIIQKGRTCHSVADHFLFKVPGTRSVSLVHTHMTVYTTNIHKHFSPHCIGSASFFHSFIHHQPLIQGGVAEAAVSVGGPRLSTSSDWGIPQHSQASVEWFLHLDLGLPQGFLPAWCAWNTSIGRRPGGILTRCLNHLSWLFSTQRSCGYTPSPLEDDWTFHLIPKEDASHPPDESRFSRLYPQSHSFDHDPSFMPIGDGRNKDWLVDLELRLLVQLSFLSRQCNKASTKPLLLHSSLTREQDPKILKLLYLR